MGLIDSASAFGSAGSDVAITIGLFTRKDRAPSVVAALVAGTVVYAIGEKETIVGVEGELDHAPLAHPFLVSLSAALLAYFGCARFGRERDP